MPGLLQHLAKALDAVASALAESQPENFVSREAVDDAAEGAVEEEPPMVDDDDAPAERLDVLHVMAREDRDDLVVFVICAEKFAHALLARHVEADGRLVEKQDTRAVEERGDELHFHPLSEAELAHHHAELVCHIQQLAQASYDF